MSSVPTRDRSPLPVRAENLVRADLRKTEMPYKQRIGLTVERARHMRGWTNDELAGKVDLDPRQVARWQSGHERPQFDLLFAIDDDVFRNALVIALATLVTDVEIDTVIRLRIKESA